MMGLLIKDLLCLRRQVKVYVIATVVYGGMTLMGVWDVSFFTWFFTLIAAMIPLSLFALDAAAKWDTYALTLPVGRNGVVAARYLFTLLSGHGRAHHGSGPDGGLGRLPDGRQCGRRGGTAAQRGNAARAV